MYHFKDQKLHVFLAHMGGPYYKNKDDGYWGIPKGEQHDNEDIFETAKREFLEETGISVQEKDFLELGFVKTASGRIVHMWAFEDGTFDPAKMICNTFALEWPPKSGKIQEFPENDRGDYFPLETAFKKILKGEEEFLKRLEKFLF